MQVQCNVGSKCRKERSVVDVEKVQCRKRKGRGKEGGKKESNAGVRECWEAEKAGAA